MSDSPGLLQHLLRSPQPAAAAGAPAGEDADEGVCPAFGYLRGARDRALHVVFHRHQSGDGVSFPYAWLGPTRHHPSLGLSLLFAGTELYLVTVKGRNLGATAAPGVDLHERGVLRHRVTWVREVSPGEARGLDAGACVVDRIDIRPVTPEEAAQLFDGR